MSTSGTNSSRDETMRAHANLVRKNLKLAHDKNEAESFPVKKPWNEKFDEEILQLPRLRTQQDSAARELAVELFMPRFTPEKALVRY